MSSTDQLIKNKHVHNTLKSKDYRNKKKTSFKLDTNSGTVLRALTEYE